MPAPKKAVRSSDRTVSTNETRPPEASDNDFTVLFQRQPASRAPLAPRVVSASVIPDPVFPPPPFPTADPPAVLSRADRTSPPLAVTLPPTPPPPPFWRPPPRRPETVTIRPRLRTRLLQAAAFLVLGGTLGVGTEVLVSRQPPGPSSTAQAGEPPAIGPDDPAPAAPPPPAEQAAGAPLVETEHPAGAHHKHRHHPPHRGLSSPRTLAAEEATSDAVDAGGDGPDDMAAAVQALSKAKEEVTIP